MGETDGDNKSVPVSLLHLAHCDVEWQATCIHNVSTRSKVDVCAVSNEGVALSHETLQAVDGTVLGDLHP